MTPIIPAIKDSIVCLKPAFEILPKGTWQWAAAICYGVWEWYLPRTKRIKSNSTYELIANIVAHLPGVGPIIKEMFGTKKPQVDKLTPTEKVEAAEEIVVKEKKKKAAAKK